MFSNHGPVGADDHGPGASGVQHEPVALLQHGGAGAGERNLADGHAGDERVDRRNEVDRQPGEPGLGSVDPNANIVGTDLLTELNVDLYCAGGADEPVHGAQLKRAVGASSKASG